MTLPAPSTAPVPEIVLRHTEPGDDLAFGRAMEVVERLDASPDRWELRDGVWHHGEHRIFVSQGDVGIQPKEGSSLIVVTMPKPTRRDPVRETRHVLDAIRMVHGRGNDDDQYILADQWCMTLFMTPADDGTTPEGVRMATPWQPASWRIDKHAVDGTAISRLIATCPTALIWEGHIEDGLPHVRIDPVEWTKWNQEDADPDAMEILRASLAIERRISMMMQEKAP